MKVFAVNGSPRGARGNTARLMQCFLEGAEEAGAETEAVYLKGLKVACCQGCFACWEETPGVCIHKDDMPDLLLKIRQADVIVYATPLYIFTVTAQMKAFMDRHLPLLKPNIVKIKGHYIHPMRYESEWPKKAVLISNCGFPETHHFSALVETFRMFTQASSMELVGTILCAAGELLRQSSLESRLRWYTDATRQAGREVVELGHISSETAQVLAKPLIGNPALYARMVNVHWSISLARKKAKSLFNADGD